MVENVQRGLWLNFWAIMSPVMKRNQIVATIPPLTIHAIPIIHPGGVFGGIYCESRIFVIPITISVIPTYIETTFMIWLMFLEETRDMNLLFQSSIYTTK